MIGLSEKSAIPKARAERGEETVTLRGTSRGFELIIADGVDLDAIIGSVHAQISKSPGFFAGSDVTIRFAGHPIPGSLGPLEEVAEEFDLTIIAVRSDLESRREMADAALAVVSDLLEPEADIVVEPDVDLVVDSGVDPDFEIDVEIDLETDVDVSAGEAADMSRGPMAEPTVTAEPRSVPNLAMASSIGIGPSADPVISPEARDAVAALALQAPDAAKIVIGPVRSGCILEATEHLVIVGDVNPGAEVTSIGAIVVLGRMRGIAHAGAGGNPAFIFALQLEPQQLRLGTKVARAGDGDACGTQPEIARIENDQIIVESYAGRLPFSLANMLS